MKFFIVSFISLAFAFALALPGKKISSRNLIVPAGQAAGRITNGKVAVFKQFPYLVSLVFYDKHDEPFWCGGSILSNEWILTAAHCTYGSVKGKVLMGHIKRTTGQVIHEVTTKDFVMHENYNHKKVINDIALIKIPFTPYTNFIQNVKLPAIKKKSSVKPVSKPVKLPGIGIGMPEIKPGKLPVLNKIISSVTPTVVPAKKNTYESYAGQSAFVAGWGLTKDDENSRATDLQWAQMRIMSNDECDEEIAIDSTNMCTESINRVSVCGGDSGGPVVLTSERIQVGIVSYGAQKCLDDYPGVHVRLTSYLEWIKKKTNISY